LETTTPLPETFNTGSKVILMAEHAGFCHGVKKAVNKAVETNEKAPGRTYVLGQLIHNQQEIDRLEAMGIHTVASLDDVPKGAVCVIRTHGATPELMAEVKAKGVELSDATCPDVSLVQNKAIELVKDGYTVVMVGKANHPEIIGIAAHAAQIAGACVVAINDPSEIAAKLQGLPTRRIGVVSQTTQLEDTFFDTVKHLAMVAKELKVFNTICPATYFRQHAAIDLAGKVELMVVVGGKNSSNTTHLADLCRDLGTPAIHIETPSELDDNALLKAATRIGVTAGASTPQWLVDEVLVYLSAL
jgi:(E)-4-hydroxy-3-methyl-but-2-enyl pyrophosphate reductase